jgi:hypothetical protein
MPVVIPCKVGENACVCAALCILTLCSHHSLHDWQDCTYTWLKVWVSTMWELSSWNDVRNEVWAQKLPQSHGLAVIGITDYGVNAVMSMLIIVHVCGFILWYCRYVGCVALNDKMIDELEGGWKTSWPNWRYCHSVCQEALRKNCGNYWSGWPVSQLRFEPSTCWIKVWSTNAVVSLMMIALCS